MGYKATMLSDVLTKIAPPKEPYRCNVHHSGRSIRETYSGSAHRDLSLDTMFSYTPWLALFGLVAAAPAALDDQACKPLTLCVDSINTCGVRYGG